MMDPKDLALRDWFAGVALGGLLARQPATAGLTQESPERDALRLAQEAYKYADAMLRERANQQP